MKATVNIPAGNWKIGPLRTEVLRENEWGRLEYQLLEPLYVRLRAAKGVGLLSFKAVVPDGFVTDFASVPRFWWRWVPPAGDYAAAAVVHDWLYRTAGVGITRFMADALFRDLMEALGVPAWKRWAMWAMVRANSWRYWHV